MIRFICLAAEHTFMFGSPCLLSYVYGCLRIESTLLKPDLWGLSVLGIDNSGSDSSSEADTMELCDIQADIRGMLRERKMFEATDHMRNRLKEIGYTAREADFATQCSQSFCQDDTG